MRQVLAMQNAKYQIVKGELNNAVGIYKAQLEDANVLKQKLQDARHAE